MTTKTTILIKTDKEVKARAQKAAKAIGIPLSTILSAYLRQFAAAQRVDFGVPLRPTARLRSSLRASQKEYERGEYHGPFSDLGALKESLDA